jgi:hypothetical protein
MNFFDKLKAQVNMNDGGKTFSNPSANQSDASQMPSEYEDATITTYSTI